ncbi:MAG TPA: GNAT family N-acetyltransferase [Gemmatimonadota bacterium]|nr:GNAT family N-acetyltransferase [Gemmatimonadota bacterium]
MATASFYKIVGFEPPWIGYISLAEGKPVGGGAFKGPPRDNRVEIAYYTLEELEGRGFATATASELINIARSAVPTITVAAQTLPTPNASNALLKNLGFVLQGSLIHPEDGEVWEWQLKAPPAAPA